MNWKNLIKYVIFTGIGVALFSMAFSMVEDKDALWNDMRSASWSAIGLSFLMGYLAIVSRGLRWEILLEPLGHKPNPFHSVHSVAFAYFANTFVPRSGELARCGALNQTDDIPVDQLFGTVISERLVDLVLLMVLTLIGVFGNLEAFQGLVTDAQLPSFEQGIPLVVLGVVIGVAIFIFRDRLRQWSIVQKAVGFFKGVWSGLGSIRNMQRKGLFMLHTLFIWVMYFMMAWLIFKSISAVAEITVLQAIFIMVAGGFGMVMPAPGGIGAYHWAVMLGFGALGYTQEIGFAVANVIWMTQTTMVIVTGGIAYLALMWYGIKRDKVSESLKKG